MNAFIRLSAEPTPRLPVESSYHPRLWGAAPTLFIAVETAAGRVARWYAVRPVETSSAMPHAILLRHDEEGEYLVCRIANGRYGCSCPDAEHLSGREQSPCKHLWACLRHGLLPWPAEPEPQPENQNGNQSSSAPKQYWNDGLQRFTEEFEYA